MCDTILLSFFSMTRLYQHLRVHQIFGANTDVGKTVLTTALCRASASKQKRVFYLKPVSTGAPVDADDGSVPLLMQLALSWLFNHRWQTHQTIFRKLSCSLADALSFPIQRSCQPSSGSSVVPGGGQDDIDLGLL